MKPVAHRLLLLRHAEADPAAFGDLSAAGDMARPLSAHGLRTARKRGDRLRRDRVAPDVVLCSPALRTRQTYAGLLPFHGGRIPEVRIEPSLYLAGADELLARLRASPDQAHTVMLVGHNPGLYELARLLNGVDSNLDDEFEPGAMAIFNVEVETLRDIALNWGGLGPRTAWLDAFSQN